MNEFFVALPSKEEPVQENVPAVGVERPYSGVTPKRGSRGVLFEISNGRFKTAYAGFSLLNYSENRAERSQIIETFGEDYVNFFGERPRLITLSGTLLRTRDFDWKYQFLRSYEVSFRGTKLLSEERELGLLLGDVFVIGYPLALNITESGDRPYECLFNMQVLAKLYMNLGYASIDGTSNLTLTADTVASKVISDYLHRDVSQ